LSMRAARSPKVQTSMLCRIQAAKLVAPQKRTTSCCFDSHMKGLVIGDTLLVQYEHATQDRDVIDLVDASGDFAG
jgi:hypothetical protein